MNSRRLEPTRYRRGLVGLTRLRGTGLRDEGLLNPKSEQTDYRRGAKVSAVMMGSPTPTNENVDVWLRRS